MNGTTTGEHAKIIKFPRAKVAWGPIRIVLVGAVLLAIGLSWGAKAEQDALRDCKAKRAARR